MHDLLLRKAIAMCMTNVDYTNIQNLIVTGDYTSQTRRLMGMTSLIAQITATYTVVIDNLNNNPVSYSLYSSQLSSAITGGEFNTILQSLATEQGVAMFATATSSGVVTTNGAGPTMAPTCSPMGSSGHHDRDGHHPRRRLKVIGGAVVGAIVLSLIIASIYACYCKRTKRNTVSPTPSETIPDVNINVYADECHIVEMKSIRSVGENGPVIEVFATPVTATTTVPVVMGQATLV